MRKRTKIELCHTAHHEAGHAVVGRVLGLTCGGVTIVPNYEEMTAGVSITQVETSISDWEARGRWRRESTYKASIFMLMAGREAEIVCLGHDGGGDGHDVYEIEKSGRLGEARVPGYGEKIGADGVTEITLPAEWLKRARAKTCSLVRRHRVAIEQVAAVLLKKPSLPAREIDRIARRAGSYVVARVPRGQERPDTIVLAMQWARSPASLEHVQARLRFYKKHGRT